MPGNSFRLCRPQHLADHIVIVDGIAHSGKGILANLLSTLDRGELATYNIFCENLSLAHSLNKISHDAASTLIKQAVDIDLYCLMISRYTNFRISDDSSAQFSFLEKRHRQRLTMPDGDPVVARIRKQKPILFYMMHHLFGVSEILFRTLENRLKLFLVCVRHPLWIVDLWYHKNWQERIGKEPREFQLCGQTGKKVVPWFAAMWLKNYTKLKKMEQAIFLTDAFTQNQKTRSQQLIQRDQKKVHFVPLEPLLANPDFYIAKFSQLLKAHKTPITAKMKKRFCCPRPKMERDAIQLQFEKVDFIMRKENSSRSARRVLDALCEDYQKNYLNCEGAIHA